MEYAHRVLGRLIGLVYLIPFLWFLSRKKIPKKLKPHLWALFFMGGLQGLIGWYMVKSGLVDDPRVSQYRLTLHLMVAVFIYGYMLRVIAGILKNHDTHTHPASRLGLFVISLILLMITTGGFVAGTHAGFIFNTFPTMAGQWLPDQLFSLSPLWRNFFENPIAIQFIHRVLAVVVLGFVLYFGVVTLFRVSSLRAKVICVFLMLSVVLQVSIGIFTLLAKVPVYLGVAHQGGALLLLGMSVFAVFLEKSFCGINYTVDKV